MDSVPVGPASKVVVRIETLQCHGTGFIFRRYPKSVLIATAAHVLDSVKRGNSSIKLYHPTFLPEITLVQSEWEIIKDTSQNGGDTIILSIKAEIFAGFPNNITVELLPGFSQRGIGAEVGWAGFPTTHPDTLCFFSGHISACIDDPPRYLVDGVAVPGVSGGPLFTSGSANTWFCVIGVVSRFHPFFHSRDAFDKRQDAFPALMQAEGFDPLNDSIAEFDKLGLQR